jgi:hypothetical protein
MMALVGEMLPQNALDPTGFENHEAEARKREEEEEDAAENELEEGHVELDEFGNKRFTSTRARIRAKIRRKIRGCWRVRDPTSSNRQYCTFAGPSAEHARPEGGRRLVLTAVSLVLWCAFPLLLQGPWS